MCQHCEGTNFENHDGEVVCQNCGLVVSSDGNFRAEIEFDEVQSGATKMRGTHIGAHQTHATSFHSRVGQAAHINSESTPAIQNALRVAEGIWSRCTMMLGMSVNDKNRANALFTAAYNRGFYRGRTLDGVALVCAYLAVRKGSNRSLMLIDFAELGDTNVFELGNMAKALHEKLYMGKYRENFIKDAREAGLNEHRLADKRWKEDIAAGKEGHHRSSGEQLYLVEPEDLINRFCDKLDFGDATTTDRVKNDAVKIAKSMKREWMVDGRRPAGVAGAAVILAARMNNFRRTLREVVLVAKVTEVTLGKRIEEFKETKSSTFSVTQFRSLDPEKAISPKEAELLGPPSRYRAQPEWQAKQAQKKTKKVRKRKNGSVPVTAAGIENGEEEETETETETEVDDETGEDDNAQPPAKRPRIDADGFVVPELPTRAGSSSRPSHEASSQPQPRRTPGRPKGAKNWRPPPPTEAEIAEEEELAEDIRDQLRQNATLDPTGSIAQSVTTDTITESETPTLDSGVVEIAYPGPQRSDPAGPPVDTNIGNLGNVCCMDETIEDDEFQDDIDVMDCLLDEEQRKVKEHYWVQENEDWLRTEHAKKVRRELRDRELREKGIDPEVERKKKKIRKDGNRVSGRAGDVSYLEDARQRNGEQDGEGGAADIPDEEGRRQAREKSVSQSARAGVNTMLQQRGTFSRRVDYVKLTQAYNLPGMDDSSEGDGRSRSQSSSRSESPAALKEPKSQHFFKPTVSRGVEASMKRRARERLKRIGGNTTAAETDAETEADGEDRSPSKSRSPTAQDENDDGDEDAEFEEDHGVPEGTPSAPSGSISTDLAPAQANNLPQRAHSVISQSEPQPSPRPTPALVEDEDASQSASPLSSMHTPAGCGSGGLTLVTHPQLQQSIGTQQQPHEVVEEIEEEDDGDYWSGEEVEDDDEERDEGDNLDKYFAGQGDEGTGGGEVMMGDEEMIVDDE